MMKDPYVYEGTDVLINKLSIRDPGKLDKAESDFASLAISRLRNSDFEVGSIFDLLEIHRRLFTALYDWAGKPRVIDIYKVRSTPNPKQNGRRGIFVSPPANWSHIRTDGANT